MWRFVEMLDEFDQEFSWTAALLTFGNRFHAGLTYFFKAGALYLGGTISLCLNVGCC
jgi:hypothetical protein